MAKLTELEAKLDLIVTGLEEAGAQLAKAKDEIIAALASVDIPPAALGKIEQLGALATALKGAAQALDDLNPDAAPPA